MSPSGAGAAGGALWGGLIGLLFLAPLFGMAIGAASGALAGKFTDVGVNDDFMKKLGASIPEGGAALIALGQSDAPDKVLERSASYGGEVIQTSLSRRKRSGCAPRSARAPRRRSASAQGPAAARRGRTVTRSPVGGTCSRAAPAWYRRAACRCASH